MHTDIERLVWGHRAVTAIISLSLSLSLFVYMYICIYTEREGERERERERGREREREINSYVRVSLCVYIYIYVYVCMCVCIYIYICICMYVCMYVYIYIYIYKSSAGWELELSGKPKSLQEAPLQQNSFLKGWNSYVRGKLPGNYESTHLSVLVGTTLVGRLGAELSSKPRSLREANKRLDLSYLLLLL